jgi:hypothetical protein
MNEVGYREIQMCLVMFTLRLLFFKVIFDSVCVSMEVISSDVLVLYLPCLKPGLKS